MFGRLSNLDSASIHELCKVKGIGLAKAAQIKSALEVGKRMASAQSGNTAKMTTSRAFVEYFAPFMKNLRKEVVKVALLDNKLKIIKDFVISEGSVNSSIVHPREVMIPAIKESATKIVLVHNHPSGDPSTQSGGHRDYPPGE
jgi:DNA repair protein RadC